jgi:membrane dipeptidase
MLIFDAHLDLAMNALEWNRDLRRPLAEIRQREAARTDKVDRGNGTVSFPEMRRGKVGLCVATQIARYVKPGNPLSGWHSPEQAWAQTQGQLAWYRAMEEAGEMTPITSLLQLDAHLALWADTPRADFDQSLAGPHPRSPALRRSETHSPRADDLSIGYLLSLEGADSLITPRHLERAYGQGLRAVGPAHYGPGTYAQGTDATGPLGPRGRELLAEMDRLHLILDATHLCDDCFWEALDHFRGPVWASHNNCRALVPHNRQFSDDQIKALIDRGAVIGAAFDAWMLVPNWIRGKTTPQSAGLTLDRVVDHLDHVCQIAGNARHVAIGSDLDGAFGIEQTPADVQTIADLARIPERLRARGYSDADVTAVAHGNLVDFLRRVWQ